MFPCASRTGARHTRHPQSGMPEVHDDEWEVVQVERIGSDDAFEKDAIQVRQPQAWPDLPGGGWDKVNEFEQNDAATSKATSSYASALASKGGTAGGATAPPPIKGPKHPEVDSLRAAARRESAGSKPRREAQYKPRWDDVGYHHEY